MTTISAPVVRDARHEDSDAVIALVSAYRHERGRPADSTSIRGAVLACIDLPEHDLVVADRGGEIVGYAAVHWLPFPLIGGCEGYISDLVVRADCRGAGVGTRRLGVIEARARATGTTRLFLNNRMDGEAFARGFFRKAGFTQRDDFANFVKVIGT